MDDGGYAQIAERALQDAAAWQRTISDALDLTYEDYGTQYASIARCVEEIERMKRERLAGWIAAYKRGREDQAMERPFPELTRG